MIDSNSLRDSFNYSLNEFPAAIFHYKRTCIEMATSR